jgi:hypothetical protein
VFSNFSSAQLAGRSKYVRRKPFWWRRRSSVLVPLGGCRMSGDTDGLQHETLTCGDNHRAGLTVALRKCWTTYLGLDPRASYKTCAKRRNSNRRSQARTPSRASSELKSCSRRVKSDVYRSSLTVTAASACLAATRNR